MIAIGVPAEGPDEPRIGLTPETVKKLVKAGAEVTVRSGAGLRSHFSDKDYEDAGATIAKSDEEAVGKADVVFTVRRPPVDLAKAMKKGAALIGMLDPFSDTAGLEMYRHRRSSFWRSFALAATPACSEKPATLPTVSPT